MENQKAEYREAVAWSYQMLGLTKAQDFKNPEALEEALTNYLNDLIVKDFNKLIGILYRIDISQEKAVAALAQNADKETAGQTMARLIIDRQKEKLYYRKLYSK